MVKSPSRVGFASPWEAVAVPSVGPAGRCWVVTLRRSGDSLNADQLLRASEERFRALSERAPIGIITSEVGLRIGYINDFLAELVGTGDPDLFDDQGVTGLHAVERVIFSESYKKHPQMFHRAQPFSHVSPQAPPTLFIHGQNDSLVPITDSQRLHHELKVVGARTHLCEVPLAQHAFEIVPSPLHQRTLRVMLHFLRTI